MFNLFKNIKTIEQEPNVYSLVLRFDDGSQYLWSGISYTLEEAILKARTEYAVKHNNENSKNNTLKMWTIAPVIEVLEEVLYNSEKQNIKRELSKNELIKSIINNKDKKLFEKNRKNFNEAEIKYIIDSLKK